MRTPSSPSRDMGDEIHLELNGPDRLQNPRRISCALRPGLQGIERGYLDETSYMLATASGLRCEKKAQSAAFAAKPEIGSHFTDASHFAIPVGGGVPLLL